MKKIFYLMLVAIVASSCSVGYWVPNARNNFGAQTTVVLDKANFRVVRNIEAVVEVNNTYLKRGDVEKSAYAELLRKANLTGSQVLTNVIVEEVRRENGIWIRKVKQYVAARATVIEFLDDSGNPIPSVSVYAQPQQAPQPVVNPTQTSQIPQTTTEQSSVAVVEQPVAKVEDYEINIPDDNFRKAILKKVDTNKDGKITKSEAMAVTSLNVSYKDITNMQGIEEFENLKKLNAQYNRFSTIDLSRNIKLSEIYLSSAYISVSTVILPKSLKVKPTIDISSKYITYK